LEKQTQPPVLYTEAGLLSAMENAGKQLENKKEQQVLKNIEIGTPATRASVIATLFNRNYIKREKKSLIPTEKGLQVYHLIKDKKIANVEMTADWELSMQKIESNELNALDFQKQIEIYTASITHELLQTKIERETLPKLQCPKCKNHQLTILDKIVKCPDQFCSWIQFRNICGIQLKTTDIEALINTGKTALIKGMKSKNGKRFNAYMVLNDQAESSFEFEK
jgi:DNA topoisomerase-3